MFFEQLGYKVVGFLPEYMLDRECIKKAISDKEWHKQPDDLKYLQKLRLTGYILATPSEACDDCAAIALAKRIKAPIVTNDKYRDHACASINQGGHCRDHVVRDARTSKNQGRHLRDHVVRVDG